jgi:hypothetical protein
MRPMMVTVPTVAMGCIVLESLKMYLDRTWDCTSSLRRQRLCRLWDWVVLMGLTWYNGGVLHMCVAVVIRHLLVLGPSVLRRIGSFSFVVEMPTTAFLLTHSIMQVSEYTLGDTHAPVDS